MKSAKKYISEYICLKILKGGYAAGDVIYSENKLAIKFNCSRLTARSALVVLVNAGILYSKKGKGYIVTPNALNVLFYARKLYYLGNKHMYSKINDAKIRSLFDADEKEFELYEVKTFYDDELQSLSFIAISRKIMKEYFESGYDFSDDTITQLINTCFIPNTIENTFQIKDVIAPLKDDINKLGYDSFAPFVKQVMYDNDEHVPYIVYSIANKAKSIFSINTSVLIN